jgi:hypothetical protein
MFLRFNRRFKNGKEHRYWNIVENKRCAGGKVVQRQVVYLGEINDSQHEAWCRQIEAFDESTHRHTQLSLFPADRAVPEYARAHGVQVRLDAMQLHQPRQWGACWLACELYEQLGLNDFWAARLPNSREGTCWRAAMNINREELLTKLGAARAEAPGAWRLIDITVSDHAATFSVALNRKKLRSVRRREGRYLLRTNLSGQDPAQLWQFYIQLVEIEAAFKTMKDDLQLRPIFHQLEQRIEAHIFVAFLAYCLHVTLRARLKPIAPGLTPRAVLDKLAAVQMLDVQFPTTHRRTLVMSRYTELNADQKLLVKGLKLDLPPQPPPRITAAIAAPRQSPGVVQTQLCGH